MFAARKKTPLENRLRELEKEADVIRQDMKVLSRAMKKPDQLADLPRLKSYREQPPPRQAPRHAPPVAPPPERPAAHPDDFFARPAQATEPPAAEGSPAERSRPRATRDERFRNYFGHGTFMPSRPLKQERQVQRNKAVFMLVVVAVFGFIVYKLFF